MEVKFTVRTTPECIEYLKIEYMGDIYSLEDFYEKSKNDNFELESMLRACNIIYKKNKLSFSEYQQKYASFCNDLLFYERYGREIMPMEISLAINNFSYYKAAKFLGKAEDCLQTARYYLMQSADVLGKSSTITWRTGYGPIFDIRTMHFKTAIIWYNNCFDYILQVVFLAFDLFKGMRGYSEQLVFEDILKLCTWKNIRILHETNPENDGLNELWEILKECRDGLTDITNWANCSKHKGGIGFHGLKAESPFQIYIGSRPENMESRTSEFDLVKIDLDDGVEKVKNVHDTLYKCMDKMVDFVDFGKAVHSVNEEQKIVIPDKRSYAKIIF